MEIARMDTTIPVVMERVSIRGEVIERVDISSEILDHVSHGIEVALGKVTIHNLL